MRSVRVWVGMLILVAVTGSSCETSSPTSAPEAEASSTTPLQSEVIPTAKTGSRNWQDDSGGGGFLKEMFACAPLGK